MRTVVNFGFSIVEASVMLGIVGCVLPSRYSKLLKYILFLIAVTVGAIGINIICGNVYVRSFVLLTIFSVFCHILYSGPFHVKVFYLLFAQYICVVSEMILSNIIMFLPGHVINTLLNNAAVGAGISILIKALVIIAGGIFVYYINRLHPKLPIRYWIVLDVILLIIIESLQAFMIVEAGLHEMKSDYLSYMIVIAYIIFLLGIFVIYFLGKICWVYEKQTEYEMAQLRGTELEKIISYQKQATTEMKKVRHDIKKHLTNILYMIEINQTDEVKDYVSNLTDVIDTVKQDNISGNYIIDAILNNHLALCKSKNITLNLSVDEISNLDINAVDVSAILDNLLDNAIEAVEKLPENMKCVTVKIFCYKDNLTTVIKNQYEGKIEIINGNIYTSKSEWEKHGYGLKSARDAVEKNHGVLKYYTEDALFVAAFMLPLN